VINAIQSCLGGTFLPPQAFVLFEVELVHISWLGLAGHGDICLDIHQLSLNLVSGKIEEWFRRDFSKGGSRFVLSK